MVLVRPIKKAAAAYILIFFKKEKVEKKYLTFKKRLQNFVVMINDDF